MIQQRMQQLLDEAVRSGRERGIQLAVYLDGQLIVDAAAGFADASGRPVTSETLFPVFSSTKGIAATLAHQLVEQGRITYDTPIASVWPEFAAHGKSGITLRHALSHTAGLQYMPPGVGYRELNDWDAMCEAIAGMTAASPPGQQQVYHAVTFSWVVGEVLCRVSGRSFGQLLQDEICRPLEITRLFVGIPDAVESDVAELEEIFEPGKEPSTQTSGQQTVAGWMQPLHTMMNRPDARRACVPASNGIMNARSLARHYAALMPGGVDGVELLPPSRVQKAIVQQYPSIVPAEGLSKGIALGYMLGGADAGLGPRPTSFGHPGYGGSIGLGDLEHRLAIGLTKNLFSSKAAHGEILAAVRAELGMNR